MLSEKDELGKVLEALLFVSGQGVEIKDIAEKLEVSEKEVKDAVEELKEKHSADGVNVVTYKNSVQLCSNPKYAEDIATVLNPIREKLLTKAAMETAAIVAYKQPVTRLDIEQIRGVSCDYALQVLINFKLVEVIGRKDAIGKPLLYGTTDEFLKRFELQTINDLPDYDELLERIAILHKEVEEQLYGSTEITMEKSDNAEQEEREEDNETERTEENLQREQEDTSSFEFTESETKEILSLASDDDEVLEMKEKDLL